MPTRKGTAHDRRDAAKGEGGKPLPRKVDAKTVRRLKPLVELGLSEREIQKTLGISRTTLQPYIKRLKTELSPNHGESHAVPANADPAAAPPAPQTSSVALVIDPEFHDLIPQLAGEARAQLERSLREEGCRDPLVAWPQPAGAPILLRTIQQRACEAHQQRMAVLSASVEVPEPSTTGQ